MTSAVVMETEPLTRGDLVLMPRGRGLVYARVVWGPDPAGWLGVVPIWATSDHGYPIGTRSIPVPAWRCASIAPARVNTYVQLNSGRQKLIRWDAGLPEVHVARGMARGARCHACSAPSPAGIARASCGSWMSYSDIRELPLADALTSVDCRRCLADRSWQR